MEKDAGGYVLEWHGMQVAVCHYIRSQVRVMSADTLWYLSLGHLFTTLNFYSSLTHLFVSVS